MDPSSPRKHRPNSLRLYGYDYSLPGAYFITVCTHNTDPIFGAVQCGEMHRNRLGEIVARTWLDLPHHYPQICLDTYIVMPDHFHGIIHISTTADSRHGISDFVRSFKSFSARHINTARGTPGTPVWQRGYYDRIIRSEHALKQIAEYIMTNPIRRELSNRDEP